MGVTLKKQTGFTIIELLIVIVVIAILAAISVVAYSGIQNRAYASAIQSDLKSIATKIEMYWAEEGVYPAISGGVLAGLDLSVTKDAYDTTEGLHLGVSTWNLLYCRTADGSQFALVARVKGGDTFQYANGTIGEYGGTVPGNSVQTLCSSAGVDISGTHRLWLYNSGSWVSWVNG